LGPQHADALRAVAQQLQQSIAAAAARSDVSHAEALRSVTDGLMARLDELPGDGLGGELAEIVKEMR
jgi:hypothetical protein